MLQNLRKYWSDFHQLTLLGSGIMFLLVVVLLFIPGLAYWLFDLDRTPALDVISRRAAMLFLGLTVIAFLARNALKSPLRRSISLGIAVAMGGLALVGFYDFMRGNVGIGIFVGIVIEVYFFSAYMWQWMHRS